MSKYLVWDQINSSRKHAREIEADWPEHAAEAYADDDCDGLADGIYEHGGAIVVLDGDVERVFSVVADYDVTFSATEAKP